MARRKGGRRGRDVEEAPVEERRSSGGAPVRAPKGLSFALPTALAAGLAAAALAFVGVLAAAKASGGGDSLSVLDQGGVAAARILAAIDTDRWRADFGTEKAFRQKIEHAIEDKLDAIEKAGDKRDREIVQGNIDAWYAGTTDDTSDWKPGLNQFIPESNPADDQIGLSLRKGWERVHGSLPGALIGVRVVNSTGTMLYGAGEVFSSKVQTGKVGNTTITGATGMRIYEHPAANRVGNPDGKVTVVLSTKNAQGAGVMNLALAAAGGAFLGGFLLALLLARGAVKAMQRLAGEVEGAARGNFAQRITARGPREVVATAKSAQRLLSLAAEGGGGGEPQIIHQPVPMVPLDEIAGGLAVNTSFERPVAFEIEATTKQCPQAGNDYYDTVNVSNGQIGVFIADIPLRGVAGAMHMARIRALFRAESQNSDSPAEVLKRVNAEFARDLPRGVYATAMYAVLDPESGVCKVAAAQHLPLVFWKLSKKSSARLATQGIALGHDAGPVFDKTIEEKAIRLDKGDRIVMFTDGAITARNAAGANYGEQRFYYVVNREAPKNSAAFVNFVANDVDLFHEGSDQLDDFTIVTVRRLK